MNYDVVVVGAGPARSTAAKVLSEKGVKVLLIDKDKFPRDKPCGGGICEHITEFDHIREKIEKDPIYKLAQSAGEAYGKILFEYGKLNRELENLHRVYMKAQMEFETDRLFYPDANFSLRVSYGEVSGYNSRDAVFYKHYTTLEGVIEKDNPEIYDYDVPEKLKELYLKKDYGKYAQDGKMPICFLATNHTTGGNSGSPVIDAEGNLIGINFDRAWEGVMSDLMFNPEQCRNISIDIRYALFIIDKFAGAGYLLDEMTLVE